MDCLELTGMKIYNIPCLGRKIISVIKINLPKHGVQTDAID